MQKIYFKIILIGLVLLGTAIPVFAQVGTSQSVEITGYRFDPAGGIGAYGHIYAPILIDRDDNSYYVNPSYDSRLKSLRVSNGIMMNIGDPGAGVVRNAAGNYTIDFQFGEMKLNNIMGTYLRMGDPGPGDCQPQGNGKFVYDISEGIAAGDANAGDVVVISKDKDLTVEPSTRAFDTRVAGVISSDPKIVMGQSKGKKPLALAGIVPCKVTAKNGAIKKGDLLVTSAVPGCAMRAERSQIKQGMLVGMALEPFNSGTGKILILVNK